MHCDTILKLMADRDKLELKQNEFSIDIGKLRRANSLAQFFALYVDMKEHEDPKATCLAMADTFHREMNKNQLDIILTTNYQELMDNDICGKISAFLTIEEGGVLQGKISNLLEFYQLGVRLITLTWNYPNEIGFPNRDEKYRNLGLTPFGEEVVGEMNRLGMLIDVSHLSDQGFYDVARLSTKPFLASHSNARRIHNHSRNLTDDMIRILADKGGITGINFEKHFLGESGISLVEDMVEHIKHIKKIGGIEVIAVGSDFDGIDPECEIENIGEIGKLATGLRVNGFSEDEIEKIFYRNAMRLIQSVL